MDNEVTDLSKRLWEHPDWPAFYGNQVALRSLEDELLSEAKKIPKIEVLDDLMISEVVANSEIEGVHLSQEKLQSSFMGNLASSPHDREANAIKAMRLGGEHFNKPLTHGLIKKLNKLFNENENAGQYVGGINIVKGGRLGEVNIVDRGMPPKQVKKAMDQFLEAYNSQKRATPLFNAVLGHVHFEKIHPFSDGNGRTGRILMNMALMRDLGLAHPLALSRAIQKENKLYYACLNKADLDLTSTVKSLAPLMHHAMEQTTRMKELTVYRKKAFSTDLNERQRKALDHLIKAELQSGYLGKFTSSKYLGLCKPSERPSDRTALRDLSDLVSRGLLVRKGAQKGAHYLLLLG
jgi:Fic family protein